ncbi:MAG TPA: GGDEF domain-containing protein [Thermoanaerobaculia bacterium]|jgi:diguanylate cyclase (GGDEF)-like protein|nr:GGDEF domain-containing protein [Thermoanaerobaculia bacterium]
MELLLWRWSTTAQIASALMIAVFFVVLSRSVRRIELRPWVGAWLANLGALGATILFWFYQPADGELIAIRFGYFFLKTLAVLLLTIGAWEFFHAGPTRSSIAARRILLVAALAYGGVASFLLVTVALIGVVQSALTAVVLGIGAVLAIRRRAGWLAAGFTLRSLLGVMEAVAYGSRLAPDAQAASTKVSIFLAAHSSFDTGAEWVIALGCVLTLYRVIQRELTQSNDELLAAKEELQALVDHDSLTGLANRRTLPAALAQRFTTGATILFFDLNDFKEINDSYGHPIGDECLKRFAAALKATFGADHLLFRYGGDEFVVIVRGAAGELVEQLRAHFEQERLSPRIRFSVGESYLAPEGDPETALREADEAMYREKRGRATRRLRQA